MFTGDKDIKTEQKSTKEYELCLKKRTKAKWFSSKIASLLYYQNENSPLRNSFRNTMYCADSLLQQGGKIITHYCKNRWCLVCNRIRTAVLIKTYMPRLSQCGELWFLTLTRPNVPAAALKRELQDLQKIMRHIMQKWRFRQYVAAGGIGIRKLECTYNPEADTYHPHFHIMFDNEDIARYVLDEWLRLSPSADPKAQDLRQVDDLEEGCKELFKYFTKLLAKNKKTKRRYFDAEHMCTIFEAMSGRRVFQRFGRTDAWRCTEVDEDAIEEEAVIEGVGQEGDVWRWLESEDYTGYYSDETGEALVEIPVPKSLGEMFRSQKDGENGAGAVVEVSEKEREDIGKRDIGKRDIARSDESREMSDRRAAAGFDEYGSDNLIADFESDRGHVEWSPWVWRQVQDIADAVSPPVPVLVSYEEELLFR